MLGLYWLLLFVGTHTSSPRLYLLNISASDKVLHFTAYLVLGLLFWLACYGRLRPSLRQKSFYCSVITMGLYAAVDELTQLLVKRNCEFTDWLSDMCGILTALLLLYLLRRWLYWLILYWLTLFMVTHWPAQVPLVDLPEFWQQFHLVYVMLAYVFLTFFWWRSMCSEPRFMINKNIVLTSVTVLPGYALLDQIISMAMRKGFSLGELTLGLAGIVLGVLCSMSFAQHHLIDDPYEQY